MLKPYYFGSTIEKYLKLSNDSVLGELSTHSEFDITIDQKNAWVVQNKILKEQLEGIDGHVYFEYHIPRIGKRVDCVVLCNNVCFVIEFKVGEKDYPSYAVRQAEGYALDLKYFHKESANILIVPILVSTKADSISNQFEVYGDNVFHIIKSNGDNLKDIFSEVKIINNVINNFDYDKWSNSSYFPSPTIIEAAQALYAGHSVDAISRSDAGFTNLEVTQKEVSSIIEKSRSNKRKSIIFISGVPGAGKTLAGLNIATEWQDPKNEKHAVFLSGNGPLVAVLQEALARDSKEKKCLVGDKTTKENEKRKSVSFIQNIHKFRDEYLRFNGAPPEHVVIFDEAQRAWTKEKTSKFMKEKKGSEDFSMSEPEFLISIMDRKEDWATIICLVGGGQEIFDGEAGIGEWFKALSGRFVNWDIFVSDMLPVDDYEISQKDKCNIENKKDLHLSVSIRSFRSEKVSSFVKFLLDEDFENAKATYSLIKDNFPMYITRDINVAREWLKEKTRGDERSGIIASSGALRLKSDGLFVKQEIKPENWFLNPPEDIRSSNYLEDVATEFQVQGLELDWVCVAWDANMHVHNGKWVLRNFVGTKWQEIQNDLRKKYLKNSYRVLLTRARQGMIIYVPKGNADDVTRQPKYYDGTFNLLRDIGIEVLE